MNSGSLLICSSKYQIKHALRYPFRYGIQLVSGSRREHVAVYVFGLVLESTWLHGIQITPYNQWRSNRDSETEVYYYPLLKPFSYDEENKTLEYVSSLKGRAKYSVIENILYKFPLLKKIRFEEDKYIFCSKLSARIYQLAGRIGNDIYCSAFDPDDIPDLLSKQIGGREIV